VSGWPGIELRAFAATEPDGVHPDIDTPIAPLRIDKLTSDVMICLWPTVPEVVTIDEPHEGVAFGFEDPPLHKTGRRLYLRSINPAGYGLPLCSDAAIEAGDCTYSIDPDAAATRVVDPATRMLDVAELLSALTAKLPGAGSGLDVRDVATQLIKVPEQAVFAAPPTR
jgi:hypothetical protein